LESTDTSFATYTRYFTYNTNFSFLSVREYSISDDGGVWFDNLSVKEVTNAWDGAPPHFTLVCWWRPGYASSELSVGVDHGIVSANNAIANLLAQSGTSQKFYSYDASGFATGPNVLASADTWYKLALQVDVNSNVYQFRVAAEAEGSTFDSASWGSWTDFDGAFTTGGNGFQLGYSLFSRTHIGRIGIWKRQLSDAEIDAYY